MLSDEVLARIAECQGLEDLLICGEGATDRGLDQLGRLKRLRKLSLDGGGLTKARIERVRRSLPACKVDSILDFVSE
jgi:hypothetical protein